MRWVKHHNAMNNPSSSYQIFILILCVFVLALMFGQVALPLDQSVIDIFQYADTLVCLVFFCDFVITLFQSDNKLRYLFTWGWLDVLSSIPSLDIARWGRIVRILRICRVLRGLRATKVITEILSRKKIAENSLLSALLSSILLITFCSIAILQFEVTDDNANIKNAEDAVWWAFSTITTAGYGDRYPVTSEGRFVAIILMSAGVGLFSLFSGSLAAWFLNCQKQE